MYVFACSAAERKAGPGDECKKLLVAEHRTPLRTPGLLGSSRMNKINIYTNIPITIQ